MDINEHRFIFEPRPPRPEQTGTTNYQRERHHLEQNLKQPPINLKSITGFTTS